MLKGNKKYLFLVASVLLTLIIVWFAAFEFAKDKIREDFDRSVSQLKSRGYEITYQPVSFSGHPLLVSARIPNLKVVTPHKWGGGETDALIISTRPWKWDHLYLDFEGKTFFDLPPYFENPLMRLSCQNCHADVWLEGEKLKDIALTSTQVSFKDNDHDLPVTFTNVSLDFKQDPADQRLHSNLSAKVLGLDDVLNLKGYDRPLEITLETETSELNSAAPSKPFSSWRDAGGVVDIKKLLITWAPMQIQGDGTFTFDEMMRPLSAFSATITGYDRLLNVMVEVGALKKKTANIASFALSLLAHRDATGEMEITVPITAQNGKLSVGPADLMPLGQVVKE